MNTIVTSGFIALSLAAAGPILAQTAKPPPPQAADFRTLDANKDGFVSTREAEPAGALHDAFVSLDKNQDGKLSPTEFVAWSGADKAKTPTPVSPGTGPSGSSGAQHMPASPK